MMPIQAVIFDFGGVLVRTEDDSGRRRWDQKLGLPPGEVDKAVFETEIAARATVGDANVGELWNHVGTILGLNPRELPEFRHDFWAGDRLDEELVTYLQTIRPGVKTAILSNAWPNARELFSEEFRLADSFDEIIISAEEGVAKPNPPIYQIAAERLGVQPRQAVFVDDVLANVEGAQAIGMWGIHFKDTHTTLLRLQELLKGS